MVYQQASGTCMFKDCYHKQYNVNSKLGIKKQVFMQVSEAADTSLED